MGENFLAYVNRSKVEQSKAMLRDGGMSIAQIASELGFSDTSHYTRIFRQYEGVTPTVYRQNSVR